MRKSMGKMPMRNHIGGRETRCEIAGMNQRNAATVDQTYSIVAGGFGVRS